MKIESSKKINIHFDSSGNGQPMLLLHGFGDDHTIWERTNWIVKLEKKYFVIYLDIRGCGNSDKSNNPQVYTLADHLNDINNVFEYLKVKEPIIWGWSFGGTIALHYSKLYKVNKTIVAGTYFGPVFTEKFISQKLIDTKDEVTIARLNALREWPIVNPNEIKNDFFIYSGTNDGNVFRKIAEQQDEIIKAKGVVRIFEGLDHFGLLNDSETIAKEIFGFLN